MTMNFDNFCQAIHSALERAFLLAETEVIKDDTNQQLILKWTNMNGNGSNLVSKSSSSSSRARNSTIRDSESTNYNNASFPRDPTSERTMDELLRVADVSPCCSVKLELDDTSHVTAEDGSISMWSDEVELPDSLQFHPSNEPNFRNDDDDEKNEFLEENGTTTTTTTKKNLLDDVSLIQSLIDSPKSEVIENENELNEETGEMAQNSNVVEEPKNVGVGEEPKKTDHENGAGHTGRAGRAAGRTGRANSDKRRNNRASSLRKRPPPPPPKDDDDSSSADEFEFSIDPNFAENCSKIIEKGANCPSTGGDNGDASKFKCFFCPRKFTKKWHMNRHLSLSHEQAFNELITDNTQIPAGYKCAKCPEVFTVKRQLNIHVKQAHSEYECKQCPEKFAKKRMLTIHNKSVHGAEESFLCTQCAYTSKTKERLNRHLLTHTGEKPFKCRSCDYECNNAYALKQHDLTHRGEKKYACQYCDYRANYRHSIMDHENVMHKMAGVLYQCDKCHFKTLHEDRRIAHIKNHEQNLFFECHICQKIIYDKLDFKFHLRKHRIGGPKEKHIECPHCDQKFWNNERLKTHMFVHTGKKEYKCRLCGSEFRAYKSMLKHFRKHHPTEKTFFCEPCNFFSNNLREIHRHPSTLNHMNNVGSNHMNDVGSNHMNDVGSNLMNNVDSNHMNNMDSNHMNVDSNHMNDVGSNHMNTMDSSHMNNMDSNHMNTVGSLSSE